MKKFNFLIALGLMATASMQAQTTVARLGFEVGDEKYTTEGALTPGGTFGDWVNVKAEDYWEEPSTDDPKSGEYCLVAKNGSTAGQTWDRGFKIGNLTIKENTPYRVSFWIKADPDFIDDNGAEKSSCLTSWLSQGIENYEKSFCTPTNANYGVQMTSGLTGDWQHISFVSYYTNADVLNNVIKDQSWVGNAVYPEAFGGDGVETYAQHFKGQLPSVFHVIINMYSPVNYSLDDIVVEEGVTFNEATFMEDVIKLDFGYPTNIAALAKANNNSFSLDPSCVSVTADGSAVPVEFVEGKSDGFLYIFLKETTLDPTAEVRVSFTPAADCPIVYNTDRRPSADTEGEMPVLGFSNELAYPVNNIDAIPSSWSPAKLLSTDPENDAFEIEAASLSKVTFQFDMEVSLDYASATIEKNGFTTPIPVSSLSLSEDKTAVYVSTAGLNLTDGDYTIELAGVENVMGVPCEGSQKVSFSVGEDKTGGTSESVYSTNETFAATANGTFPVGWVANDNGTIHQYGLTEGGEIWNYNWGGNLGGGGCRAMTGYSGDLNGAAIYWRCFNGENQLGTLTFGEQVKDFQLADGSIDPAMDPAIALKLEATKYQITIRMCAWKNLNGNTDAVSEDNAPKYTFTLEDLEGNVYAQFVDVPAMPNVNGAQNMAVNNVTKSVTDFTVEKAGYYVLKFSSTQPSAELLLGGVDIITMPSKAAYYKQLLSVATEEAKKVLATANLTEYDGETKTTLINDIDKAENGHFTSPTEVNDMIAKLQADSEKMTARVNNIDNFSIAIIEASSAYEGLEGKYKNAEIATTAKAMIDKYGSTNPSDLSDDELAEVTPKLMTAASQLGNVNKVVDILTYGIYKATQAAIALGADAAEGYEAVDDDRALADAIKTKATIALYNKIAAGEDLTPFFDKVFDDVATPIDEVPEGQEDLYDEQGRPRVIYGLDLSGFIYNPHMYTFGTNSGANLEDNSIVGWNCTQLEGGGLHFSGDAATEAMPVSDVMINAYGAGGAYRFYQELTDLPVGIYDFHIGTRTAADSQGMPYNDFNDETGIYDKYMFVQVDDNEPVMVPFAVGGWGTHTTVISGIEVKEGAKVTIGVVEDYQSGKAQKDGNPTDYWDTNTFCDDARAYFVAPLKDYDYAKAAEDLASGVETIRQDSSNAAIIGIYNVNGARQSTLRPGINIIKRADGKVNKVLVK